MYIYEIMIVTNLEKLNNKCSFAKSNSINYNTSIYNICSNTTISAAKRTKLESSTAKCSSQRTPLTELPKEVLSTVTLTTHMLPTEKTSTHFSYRSLEAISRCNNSNDSNTHHTSSNSSSSDNCCGSNCSTSCRTSDCNKRKMKIELLEHDENQHHTFRPVLSTTSTSTKTALATAATNIESSFLPTFKYRHRKFKTISVTNKNNTRIQQQQQQQQQQHSVALTTKPTPLMTADSTTKLTKKSRTRKTKSISVSSCKSFRLRPLPGLKVTSLCSLLTLICLETVLLSTVSNCAKTFYMHWNTSNSIFRIDNTDHIIDVNKGNLAFEFDQVHIICPVYEPGTFENETEKYIIYNVSKVEYETCRITNADPRVIAICDKPQKLMFFTITFRPFTPQPGGLEFLPGNDYYFISTSSKDDLYRRIGGRCSTNNMKVVFKVCCAPEDKSNKTLNGGASGSGGRNTIGTGGSSVGVMDSINNLGANGSGGMNAATAGTINQQHMNSINTGLMHGGGININNGGGVLQKTSIGNGIGTSGTSINTNIDQFNRIPTQTNSISGISNGIGLGSHGSNGVLMSPGVVHGVGSVLAGGGAAGIGGQYPGHQQTGIRINNVPSSQQHPSLKNNNADDHYNKHPNEVVKNEELTYNSAGSSLHHRCKWKISTQLYKVVYIGTIWTSVTTALNSIDIYKSINIIKINKFTILDNLLLKLKNLFCFNISPIIIISVLLATFSTYVLKFQLNFRSTYTSSSCQVSLRKSTKSSYLSTLSSNKRLSIRTESDEKCANKKSNTTTKSYTMSNDKSNITKHRAHILSKYHNQR